MAKVCPGEHPRCALVVRLVWLEQRMLMGEELAVRLQRCLRRRCGSCDDMQRTSPLQHGASDYLWSIANKSTEMVTAGKGGAALPGQEAGMFPPRIL